MAGAVVRTSALSSSSFRIESQVVASSSEGRWKDHMRPCRNWTVCGEGCRFRGLPNTGQIFIPCTTSRCLAGARNDPGVCRAVSSSPASRLSSSYPCNMEHWVPFLGGLHDLILFLCNGRYNAFLMGKWPNFSWWLQESAIFHSDACILFSGYEKSIQLSAPLTKR